MYFWCFVFASRRRHTRCALVTGVQTCALPISYQKHEEHACDEIAVAKECALEQRPSGRCEMNHGDPESGNRNAAFDQDFPALEPVFVLAAVEHQLKGRNAQRYHAEAETVEARADGLRSDEHTLNSSH